MSKERILKKEITLPYNGQVCKIYRLKAKDINAAQKIATTTVKKLDGKESTNVDTGKLMLILLSRACTFNDKALTPEEIEELELLNDKYIVGDKTIENLTIALRIKELTDKCDNTEK
jgi:hypothetical protein